jgi:hypothetical protein
MSSSSGTIVRLCPTGAHGSWRAPRTRGRCELHGTFRGVVSRLPPERTHDIIDAAEDVPWGELDAFLGRQIEARGFPAREPVPVVISGPFADLHWHVVDDGMRARGGADRPAHLWKAPPRGKYARRLGRLRSTLSMELPRHLTR